MKKIIAPFILVAALTLTGCGGSNANPEATDSPAVTQEAPQTPDLAGTWKQINSASEDSYQQATVKGNTITVDWVSDGGDTTSTYWIGTFEAPTDAVQPYTWSSKRDAAKTDSALLASTDDTKEFTYEDGVISYKVSALGTTTTVKLETK